MRSSPARQTRPDAVSQEARAAYRSRPDVRARMAWKPAPWFALDRWYRNCPLRGTGANTTATVTKGGQMQRHTGISLGLGTILLVGGIGAGLFVLYAPARGAARRRALGRAMWRARGRAADVAGQLAADVASRAKEQLDEVVGHAKQQLDSVVVRVNDALRDSVAAAERYATNAAE
jgi:hypothetical protein